MVAHYIASNEDKPDQMQVNYASAYGYIKNASIE